MHHLRTCWLGRSCIILALVATAAPVWAKVIYVKPNGRPTGPGTSWSNAYTLAGALAAAEPDDELWVQQGTYRPGTNVEDTFELAERVSVYGGFAGNESQREARDWQSRPTILDGNRVNRHVVTANWNSNGAVLDGFTITRGNANGGEQRYYSWGGGIFIEISSPTFVNCRIEDNHASSPSDSDDDALGGGVFTNNATAHFINCLFINNSATAGFNALGGALFWSGWDEQIMTNCTFLSNTAQGGGDDGFGGGHGGAIFLGSGRKTVVNCMFSGNEALGGFVAGGGAIDIESADPQVDMVNCTFIGNRTYADENSFGGGVFAGHPRIVNCIFWGNMAQDDEDPWQLQQIHGTNPEVVPNINFSCVYGWDGSWGGVGNTGAEPGFVDGDGPDDIVGTEDDNPRLAAGSPLINVGDNLALPLDLADLDGDGRILERTPIDRDGKRRIIGPKVDMGAYEFGEAGPCTQPGVPVLHTPNVLNENSVELSWSAGSPAGDPVITYYWALGTNSDVSYETNYLQRGATSDTSVTISGLNRQTTYYFAVAACSDCDNLCSDPAGPVEFSLTTCQLVTFTSQPQSQTVCPGKQVTFTVQAEGTGSISYRWRQNGVVLPGATQAQYTIDTVAAEDAGQYDVVVTNDCGSITSEAATLTVYPPVEVVISASPGLVVCGAAKITLSAGEGYTDYQWSPGGEQTASITVFLSGEYSVTVTDANGCTGSHSVTVRILQAGDPGDFDADCDIDLDDYAHLYECLTGPDQTVQPICRDADLDDSSLVDLNDYAAFTGLFTGP